MNAVYDQSPGKFVVSVVFFGPTSTVSPKQFKYAIKSSNTTYINNDYIKSRFLTAQAYVERAAINVWLKGNNKPPISSPLPLKTNHGKAVSGAGRSFVSYARFIDLGVTHSSLNAFSPSRLYGSVC
ncbi:hypothetical protein BGZ93_007873 [Podila epicladia]|nr:hypothetical protein BGZ93_007873 [Podila epicladia]